MARRAPAHQGNGNGNGSRNGKQRPGTLIIIGGAEDRKGEKVILRELARRIGDGKLVVTTVASHEPEGFFEEYERIFRGLGLHHLADLDVQMRQDAVLDERVRALDDATGVFFTGGDQLKITSQIGDTPIFRRIEEIYRNGGVIAGTSAGASVMCETMMVSGAGDESHRLGDTLRMAPGLALIPDVIIDQHFAERGRIGRLLGAVAQNPRNLGIGIDEDTAIIVEGEEGFRVIGSGCVYILDGVTVTGSNVAEENAEHALSIYDVKLHVLSDGDRFDLRERRPGEISRRQAAEVDVREAESAEETAA